MGLDLYSIPSIPPPYLPGGDPSQVHVTTVGDLGIGRWNVLRNQGGCLGSDWGKEGTLEEHIGGL